MVQINRYGKQYWFEQIGLNEYTIAGELDFWRFGGREGQVEIDMADLGFVDPSGGPLIKTGHSKIDGHKITHIAVREGRILFTTEVV